MIANEIYYNIAALLKAVCIILTIKIAGPVNEPFIWHPLLNLMFWFLYEVQAFHLKTNTYKKKTDNTETNECHVYHHFDFNSRVLQYSYLLTFSLLQYDREIGSDDFFLFKSFSAVLVVQQFLSYVLLVCEIRVQLILPVWYWCSEML